MRLSDAKSSHWAIRHIEVFVALAGFAVLIGGYFASLALEERNQDLLSECFSQTGEDCPNFMYYHDGGDSTLVFFLSIWVGSGLLVASGVYWAIKP